MFPILTAFETIQRDSAISFPMLGNFSIDPPSYFTVFGREIYFYGVLIALGFLLDGQGQGAGREIGQALSHEALKSKIADDLIAPDGGRASDGPAGVDVSIAGFG